jgi:hypothetical protein
MLRQMDRNESVLIKDDPVRPRFTYDWRTSAGREVWVWDNNDTIDAVICCAYTNGVPRSEEELEQFSAADGATVVFYTVWSYTVGAGRTLVNELAQHLRDAREGLEQWVTLSPLTEMATTFHLRNGARLLQVNETTQNFDYTDRILRTVSSDSVPTSM